MDFGWPALFLTLLVACHGGGAGITRPAAVGIEGIEWRLSEVAGVPFSPMAGEPEPFLTFDDEKRQATGFAGCNNFFAGYELSGSALTFGLVGSTRMACADRKNGLEKEFFSALEKTRTWKINGSVLLLLDGGEVLARFRAANPSELTGTAWLWQQTLYNDDRKAVPGDPAKYVVRFREDGTLGVKADCNQKGGTYSASAKERRLSIAITHSTMAACPEGSLENEFERGLSAATSYFIKNGDLYLDLKYDSGTMRFSK